MSAAGPATTRPPSIAGGAELAAPDRPLARHRGGVLAALVGLALLAAASAAWIDLRASGQRRLDLLQIEAQRKSVEIMSATLSGNLMGALTLLGRTDEGISQEARNADVAQDPRILVNLRSAGEAFGANGVFVVGRNGVIGSSWDASSKPSGGLDVGFRPYFKTALAGKTNIYAAVSVSQGERVLYFAAPIMAPADRSPVGAVVARTDVARLDTLLRGNFDSALLLSPQQIVFAASQPSWVGHLAAEPTAPRLAAIRALRQFGTLFDHQNPRQLPFDVSEGLQGSWGHRQAMAIAQMNWNDPSGPWTLVLTEDLERSVPISHALNLAALAFFVTLLLGVMSYRLWLARQRQLLATEQLRRFAAQQQATADFRAELSRTAARLQRCERLPELASTFLQAAREMLGAMNGAIYAASVGSGTKQLHLIGSAAAPEPPPAVLELGEGLLGESARDRRRIVLETPPHGPWRMRSGLGNAMPGALLLAPLVRQDELVGMVELGLRAPPGADHEAWLDELLSLLTNSLEILRRREAML